MGTIVNFDIGTKLSIRHGNDESSLFEFIFELDYASLDEAGWGHNTYFSFVYDVATGKVVEITSNTDSEYLEVAQVHPNYDGNMGTEYVRKYDETLGSGDVVYSFLSFEPDEIDDASFASSFEEITSVFFDICVRTVSKTKAHLL